jgi:DNA-binding CsgD family transcriptional regulator
VPPFVIVEGPDIALDHAVREVGAAGWQIAPGFHGPFQPGRFVRSGTVATASDAEAALLAALAGHGIVVLASADAAIVDRLVDDLRRLGPVEHRVGQPATPPEVSPVARAILGLLAEGHSLGEAAAILGLSRRTADRRLAEGRRALGAERTTEAIAMARRLGWLERS